MWQLVRRDVWRSSESNAVHVCGEECEHAGVLERCPISGIALIYQRSAPRQLELRGEVDSNVVEKVVWATFRLPVRGELHAAALACIRDRTYGGSAVVAL